MTQPIRAVLAAVLQHTKEQQGPLFRIQRNWARLVGKELAAHTKPVSLRRGRLMVYAEEPGESFALKYAKPELLKRLRTAAYGNVSDVVVRPGEIGR